MINCQREILNAELAAELVPLLAAHWREIARYQDIELDPDWESYFAMEASGHLRCYTAREVDQETRFFPRTVGSGDEITAHSFIGLDGRRVTVGGDQPEERGRLVGYVAFFVQPSMHYRRSRQAVQDVLYLDPAHRRGRAGLTLIRVAETRLRAEGVQVVYHHAKVSTRVGELLEALGYELVDALYAKRLDIRS